MATQGWLLRKVGGSRTIPQSWVWVTRRSKGVRGDSLPKQEDEGGVLGGRARVACRVPDGELDQKGCEALAEGKGPLNAQLHAPGGRWVVPVKSSSPRPQRHSGVTLAVFPAGP